MKKWLIICLLVELVFFTVIFGGSCFLRKETVNAHWAWNQNPTEENRKEFDRQMRIGTLEKMGFGVVGYLVVAGVTISIFRVAAKGRTNLNNHETAR